MAAPAKTATPDDIMSPAELKPMLNKSKTEKVSCALGLTADKEAVLLLHKTSKPRALAGALRTNAAKIKLDLQSATVRFGHAEVDSEVDSTLIVFRVNKEVPGNFEQKFRERTKRAGLSKVQFVVDESLNEEEGAPAAPGEAPATDGGAPDWTGLAQTLAGLIGKLQAAGPDAKALFKDASDASAAVKAKTDFAAASAAVSRLSEALGRFAPAPAAEAPAAKPSGGSAVAYAKSRLAWLATRKKVEAELAHLQSEIVATYDEDGIGPELASSFTAWVAPVLDTLDERLADALDAATNEADPAKRAELVAQARAIIGEYTTYLQSDPRFGELDDNPFFPLSLRSTIGGTLSALAQAIH